MIPAAIPQGNLVYVIIISLLITKGKQKQHQIRTIFFPPKSAMPNIMTFPVELEKMICTFENQLLKARDERTFQVEIIYLESK